jgi:wobble nucleotide-excising tRNase
LILQVIGVIALGAGLYMKGGYSVEMEWRERVAELEAKVAAAEVKSKEVNTVIQEKIVTKIKKVKDVQVKLQREIVEKEKIINAECTVPLEAIELLNKAAERPTGETK